MTHLLVLPASEYSGWLAFYTEKERRDQVAKGNLLAMEDDEIAGNLKALGVLD